MRDTRHQDLKLLSRKMVNALSFPDWAMKYVPLEKEMNRLLAMRGLKTFDPYQFDADMVTNVLALLHSSADAGTVYEADVAMQKMEKQSAQENSGEKWKMIGIVAAVLVVGIAAALLARQPTARKS